MVFRYKNGDRPLEGYTIQRGVGAGGFGEVYYALSDGGRQVALKCLSHLPEVELRGVGQCMNLKSPQLVTIFDVKTGPDGAAYVIMEYVAGPSLRELLSGAPAGLGPEKSAFLVREIAKGLGYLHERGIVHRDLKPENIFFEDGTVKIGDYGLSKYISVTHQSAQTISVGTVHYMAPEIGSGRYHRGIDIYALGVILFEMLTGRVPFTGDSFGEVLMKHLTLEPDLSGLPAPFAPVVRKALAKDPDRRYLRAEELARDLEGSPEVRAWMGGFRPESLSRARASPIAETVSVERPATPAVLPPARAAAPAPAPAADERRSSRAMARAFWNALSQDFISESERPFHPPARAFWLALTVAFLGLAICSTGATVFSRERELQVFGPAFGAVCLGYSVFAARVGGAAFWPGFLKVGRWFLATTFFNVATGFTVLFSLLLPREGSWNYLVLALVFASLAVLLGVILSRLFWPRGPHRASMEGGRS